MWIRWNPNPRRDEEPDCVIRAICAATGMGWHEVFWGLCRLAAEQCTMPSSNWLWGLYLKRLGFVPFLLPESCPECVTVRAFCRQYPDVPDNILNDPNQILQYLQQTRNISNDQLQQLMGSH